MLRVNRATYPKTNPATGRPSSVAILDGMALFLFPDADFAFGPTISTDGVSIQYVFWLGGTHTDRQELPSFGVYDCHGAAASMCVGTTIILNVAYLLGDGRSEYLLGALINPLEK